MICSSSFFFVKPGSRCYVCTSPPPAHALHPARYATARFTRLGPALGGGDPIYIFTDNPRADQALLLKIWPSLAAALADSDVVAAVDVPGAAGHFVDLTDSDDDLEQLTLDGYKVLCVTTIAEMDSVRQNVSSFVASTSGALPVIALDCEWVAIPEGKVAVVTICHPGISPGWDIAVIHLAAMGFTMPHSLKLLLESDDIAWAGSRIKSADRRKLMEDYGLDLHAKWVPGLSMIDLAKFGRRKKAHKASNTGLAKMVRVHVKKILPKPADIRVSFHWGKTPLPIQVRRANHMCVVVLCVSLCRAYVLVAHHCIYSVAHQLCSH